MNNIGVHGYDLLGYLLGAEVCGVSAMVSSEPGFELDTTGVVIAPVRLWGDRQCAGEPDHSRAPSGHGHLRQRWPCRAQ
jgi:hypothetical protein